MFGKLTKTKTMTSKQISKEIKKAKDKLSKGNFKAGQESELWLRVDGLINIESQLWKLEQQLDTLNNR